MVSRLKYLLIPTIALTLAAGMVIGRISNHRPATAATQPTTKPGEWFDEQLNLSADQRKQMETIWGDVHQNMGKSFDSRRQLDEQRDQSIKDLLSDDQKKAYDEIYTNYRAKRTDLDKLRDKLFADANQRSRAILSPDQQKRWDTLSQEHHGPGGPGGRGRGGNRSGTQPSSRPSGNNNFGGPDRFGGAERNGDGSRDHRGDGQRPGDNNRP